MQHDGRTRRAWWVTLTLAALIAVAALVPSPGTQGAMPSDKVGHVLAFFVLALPLARVRAAMFWPVILIVVAYGGMIEAVQPLVGRNAEWADLGADALGALGGACLGRWMALRRVATTPN